MKCNNCNNSESTICLKWTDYYPEGSSDYNDHICLQCGLYVDGNGCKLKEESLITYREQYSYLLLAENHV